MRKMMLVFIVLTMLLSGCISGGSKSGNSKTGSNGDEYSTDNSLDQDDSGTIQTDYNSLALNSNDSNVSDVQSTIYANKAINIFDNTAINASKKIN